MLSSKVFFPVKATKKEETIPIIGNQDHDTLPYLFNSENEEKTLAIFTEEPFLFSWAEKEINCSDDLFKKLIWKIPPNTCLHLNPNQSIGKIFTPLEIELFKKEDFEELTNIIKEDEIDDFEIHEIGPEFLKLKSALLPVLTIYEELEEAYLLTIKERSSNSPRALVGIKYKNSITDEKIKYIRSEIERTANEFLISPFTGIFIVDDLHDIKSPNQTLFIDFEPFYRTE